MLVVSFLFRFRWLFRAEILDVKGILLIVNLFSRRLSDIKVSVATALYSSYFYGCYFLNIP